MHVPHYIKHEKMSENYQTNKISRATSAFPNKRDVLLKSGKFNLLEKEMPEKNNMNTISSPLDFILIEGYNLDNYSVYSSLLDLNKFK
jgi:hypothetical protein